MCRVFSSDKYINTPIGQAEYKLSNYDVRKSVALTLPVTDPNQVDCSSMYIYSGFISMQCNGLRNLNVTNMLNKIARLLNAHELIVN